MLFKLIVLESDSSVAEDLLGRLLDRGRVIVAPDFAWAEVGSALRRRVRQGWLSAPAARDAWSAFRALPLVYLGGDWLADRAWVYAQRFGLPTVYDAAFLAAGEDGGFWTADHALLTALGTERPDWVRALGDSAAGD